MSGLCGKEFKVEKKLGHQKISVINISYTFPKCFLMPSSFGCHKKHNNQEVKAFCKHCSKGENARNHHLLLFCNVF